MKIAITGASGHIGANLCRELLKQGHQVRALVHNFKKSLEGLGLEQSNGNLLNKESLHELVDGAEIVIHLGAAISIEGTQDTRVIETNITGTRNILEAIKNRPSIKRFIHFSSIHALKTNPPDQPLDETRPLAIDDPMLYNHTKALGEQMVLENVKNGLDAVIINPTSVIGPYDYVPSLIGQAIIQIYNNKLPALIPGGYDWVDVRDVVKGTISAMEKGRTGERYLLSGKWESLVNLFLVIKELHPGTKMLPVLPYWVALIGVPFLKAWAWSLKKRPLYTRDSIKILKSAPRRIISEKAEKELNYTHRPLVETITDTLEWFRQNNYIM